MAKFKVLSIVFIITFIFLGCGLTEVKNKVCLENNCFCVELAKTPHERTQGLMDRESLSRGEGMLFIFPKEDIYGFWMKNTNFPLDIVWINSRKEVVFLERFVQPCDTTACTPIIPDKEAKYVLEINAGLADATGIIVGEILDFDLIDYKEEDEVL
ncbi:MAG: DUF192 domain-containing protein [Candidatus Omnitrophica bacterium]|nr:DUF192 domain-containing protein [Candidatus Omnitrophota bacterium]